MNTQISRRIVKSLLILTIAVIFGAAGVITGKPVKTNAAEIPKGSNVIETATAVTPGNYTGPALEFNEVAFYKTTVKAGQELKVVGRFKSATTEYGGTINTINLYNEERTRVDSQYDGSGVAVNTVAAATLANSEKASQTYYIEISDTAWATASSELDISVIDRYDAGSTTDAGQIIEKALTIKPGAHKGYLSQNDTDDFYSVPASAGKFSVKVTPNGKLTPTIEIYDQNRTKIAEQTADNAGQIFTLTTNIQKTENIFLHFSCDINTGCVNEARGYDFVTSTSSSGEIAQSSDDKTATTNGSTKSTNTNKNNMKYVWIGLAALAVVLAVIAFVVMSKRRNKNFSASAKKDSSAATDKNASKPEETTQEEAPPKK